jgi:4-amino-4-deoxy-L-arabinose transferase-like glycosyltransferase
MQGQQSSIRTKQESVQTRVLRVKNSRIIDIAFLAFLVILSVEYYSSISTYHVPISDGAAYLTNAQNWLLNEPLYQIYRPPLISWLIAGVWAVAGENWQSVQYLSALFGFCAACVAYITLRRTKGTAFALGVVALTMLSPQVFYYTAQILTEALSLFLLLATLYFVKSEKPTHWFLAGISIGLTFASRYPIVLQAGLLAMVESCARRNWQILSRAIAGATPVMSAVILIVFLKTGTFQTALPKDSNFTLLLSPYYLQNSIVAWGWVFLLVPIAFVLRGTYADRYNWSYIAWFVVGMLFWSANATNHDVRYTIQFTPAVFFLALLTLEAFVKNNESLGVFLRRELLFLRFKNKRSTENLAVPAPLPQPKPVASSEASPMPRPSPELITGTTVPVQTRFKTCPNCARQVGVDDRFCDGCGFQISAHPPT